MLLQFKLKTGIVNVLTHPRTAWIRRSEGYAVRTLSLCLRMSWFTVSTCLSPPFTMKAGIQSTLSFSCCKRRMNRSRCRSSHRPPYTRGITEGFIVVKSDLKPTSSAKSSRGARLHLLREERTGNGQRLGSLKICGK